MKIYLWKWHVSQQRSTSPGGSTVEEVRFQSVPAVEKIASLDSDDVQRRALTTSSFADFESAVAVNDAGLLALME